MAETKETVVFEVNVDSYEKQLIELTKSINGLADVQAKLTKEAKKGNEESAKSLEQVNIQLGLAKKQYKDTQSILVGYNGTLQKQIDLVNFSNNSFDKNVALQRQLTAQYNASEGVARQKLIPVLKDLNETINRQKLAVGDTRLNVGRYFEDLSKGIPQLGAAIEGFKGLGIAFNSAGGGIKGFTAALATTGLPLIIAGVNLLIEAFKTFEPLVESVEDAMGGLSSAFSIGYENGVKLVQLRRELEQADRDALITNAKYRKEISELEAAAKNKTLDPIARVNALKEANKIREEQLQYERDLNAKHLKEVELQAQKEIASAKTKSSALGGFRVLLGIRTDTEFKASKETLDKLAELRAKDIDLQTAQGEQVIENNNRIAQFSQQAEEETTKAAKENSETRIKIKQEELKSLEVILKKESEAKEKELEDENERELNAQVKSAQITAKRLATVEAAIDAEIIARNRLLQNEKLTETERQNIIRESEDKIAEIKKNARDKEEKMLMDGLKNQEQSIIQAVIQITNGISGILTSISNLINQTAQENIESLEAQAKRSGDAQKRIEQETRAIRLKAWKESKAIAITQAVMNTANAIMAQLSNPTPYVGIVLAAIAAATGAIQIATIAKQKPPRFAKGVIGLKGAGTETSDSIDAKLSKGESVITAKATQKYHRELAQMEMSVGNTPNYNFSSRKFATGVIGMSDNSFGGFATRDTARETSIGIDNITIIEKIVRNMPSPKLSIVELEAKQKSRSRSVKISSL